MSLKLSLVSQLMYLHEGDINPEEANLGLAGCCSQENDASGAEETNKETQK
jgi:hypothetical protein